MRIADPPQMKIYSSREFLPSGVPHVTLLYPFWGCPPSERSPDVYRGLIAVGQNHFRVVPNDEADFFVLPFDWRYATKEGARSEQDARAAETTARRFSDKAAHVGKRLIVFYVGDSEEEIPLDNSVVFRTSLRRGARPNEFAMTVFFEDIIEEKLGSRLPFRPRLQYPSVGFCGFAGYRLMPAVKAGRKARRVARWLRDGFPAPTIRERAMRNLERDPSVVTDFVLREHGLGRAAYDQRARDAFYRNMTNSDYILCARGLGNWSIRLYETLACARVPLFIDTECVLPYDFEIVYKDHVVWVESQEIDAIAEQLLAFHESLNDQAFADHQRACRQIWEDRLTPHGFFSNFYKHFEHLDA